MYTRITACGQRSFEPSARTGRVVERFLSRERFRNDDEQRGRRIASLQRARQLLGVDVRYECYVDGGSIGRQRLADETRAEIGAADADVNHGLEWQARRAFALPFAKCPRDVAHPPLCRADV